MAKKGTAKVTKKKNATGKVGATLRKLERVLATVADVKPPPIPVEHLVAEGHALARVAAKYTKELRRVSVEAKVISSIADRATALAEAQSALALVRRKKKSQHEVALEAKGIDLRSEMVADGRFALRGNGDAQAALDHIQEGEGLDDLVQDLRDLAAFAKQYKTELAKVGVKVEAKAKEALAVAVDLQGLVVSRRVGDAAERSAMELRDRASTYLLAVLRDVRAAGAYAFRRQPEIAARFRGAYEAERRARRTPRAKSKAVAAPGNSAPSADA